MNVIWKFPLEFTVHEQLIAMPQGATILTVQMQRGTPCLWATVDSNAPQTSRRIAIVGTGLEIKEHSAPIYKYIGTFQMADGAFVWHVFELQERAP
jgi:hypothetical protein